MSSAADSLNLLGKTIADKYVVESVVGEGGFATVYRAQHTVFKRPVALKVFTALEGFSETDRERLLKEFIQEGTVLADLSERTAAICQARDIGTLESPKGDKVPYMVLEWLEGRTLEETLADERARALPLRSMADAVKLLEPAAEALALAHKRGIAHRDVKPANVFLIGDPRGDVSIKLLDFGIAKVVMDAQKAAGTFTKTGGNVTSFTPAYGAPEQFSRSHGATGPWTDVFALALMVAEVVTGRHPLEGDDFVQLAVASAHPQHRPTPRALGADVSDAVEEVFLRAVAIKPNDRYQSADAFWNALRGALAMEPMRGIRTTNPEPARSQRAEEAMRAVVQPRGATGATAADVASAHTIVDPSTTAPQPPPAPRSRAGLFVGVGVAVAAVAVLGVVAMRGAGSASSGSGAGAGAGPSAGASASSGAVAGCPAGMIAIPGGRFYMGSDEKDALPNEKPSHQVALSPFCIDRYEVTVADFKACSDRGACRRASQTNEFADLTDADRKAYDPLCNIRDPVAKAKHPINCVDWDMANDYCKENDKRLPTEAEWEYAARGPDGRRYPWGDDEPTAGLLNACGAECVAWGKKNGEKTTAMYEADDGFANTAPVGSFPKGASRYGVEDVVGNVWEWVADYMGAYSSGGDEQKNPKGPSEGTERVIRGGAWNGSYPSWVRPTFRYMSPATTKSHGIGFRCAK